MYTSAINRMENIVITAFIYLFISIFCILFGAVYEYFSHEVYSYFMLYAFVFPLVGGTLPFFGIIFCGMPIPNSLSCNLYHSGIAALTAGSLFQGALEIYGTTNRLVSLYWILGILFSLAGIILYFICSKRKIKNIKTENDGLDL